MGDKVDTRYALMLNASERPRARTAAKAANAPPAAGSLDHFCAKLFDDRSQIQLILGTLIKMLGLR